MKPERIIPDLQQAFDTSGLRHNLPKGTFIPPASAIYKRGSLAVTAELSEGLAEKILQILFKF